MISKTIHIQTLSARHSSLAAGSGASMGRNFRGDGGSRQGISDRWPGGTGAWGEARAQPRQPSSGRPGLEDAVDWWSQLAHGRRSETNDAVGERFNHQARDWFRRNAADRSISSPGRTRGRGETSAAGGSTRARRDQREPVPRCSARDARSAGSAARLERWSRDAPRRGWMRGGAETGGWLGVPARSELERRSTRNACRKAGPGRRTHDLQPAARDRRTARADARSRCSMRLSKRCSKASWPDALPRNRAARLKSARESSFDSVDRCGRRSPTPTSACCRRSSPRESTAR